MRISWLEPEVIRTIRAALRAGVPARPARSARPDRAGLAGTSDAPDWALYFVPEFRAPRTPMGYERDYWERVAEHVARVERVSQVIREDGLEAAYARFRGSGHAVEQATLVVAAVQTEQLEFELLGEFLGCDIDELLVYGTFLDLLSGFRASHRDQALTCYETFCAAFVAVSSAMPHWPDRVNAVRDGLASFYIRCGRHDDGHRLFLERHEEDPGSMLAALAASRSFWSAGATGMAIDWLGRGAQRARALGRPELAARLREKQDVLRSRQS